jgi:hypothetical protein
VVWLCGGAGAGRRGGAGRVCPARNMGRSGNAPGGGLWRNMCRFWNALVFGVFFLFLRVCLRVCVWCVVWCGVVCA